MFEKDWRRIEAVHVRFFDGSTRVYLTLDAAVRGIGYRHIERRCQDGRFYAVGSACTEYLGYRSFYVNASCELRDEHGLLIPDDLIDDAIDRTGIRFYQWRGSSYPVTRYRRPRGGAPEKPAKALRAPRWSKGLANTQRQRSMVANRAYAGFRVDEDLRELKLPVKRRARAVFDAWDSWEDHGRSDWGKKSWKRHRKHQYKD